MGRRSFAPGLGLQSGPGGVEHSRVKCPVCRIRQLVVIEIRVAGEPLSLHSCSHCDRRWWQGIDGLVPLGSVLELAARRKSED